MIMNYVETRQCYLENKHTLTRLNDLKNKK